MTTKDQRASVVVNGRGLARRDSDSRCGTASGFTRHQNRGEEPCALCTIAKADYDADWRAQPENVLRNRLAAKAQALALREIKDAHLDDYREAYARHKDRLFAEASIERRPKGEASA